MCCLASLWWEMLVVVGKCKLGGLYAIGVFTALF